MGLSDQDQLYTEGSGGWPTLSSRVRRLVPDLAFNLLSITAASERGKVTTFTQVGCEIREFKSNLVTSGHRKGSLYYLHQGGPSHQACVSNSSERTIWHRRLSHLENAGMEELARHEIVRELDINTEEQLEVCESCAKGKNVWVYILKHEDEVFSRFQEWKAEVERSTGRQMKTLCSDNGDEYTSKAFTSYLVKEGIKHELTIPHTPKQNGVAERLNHKLIEGVCTMLADSKLPHRFWAEALSTMVYLRNCSPTKVVGGVTPQDAWSGLKQSSLII